MLRVLICEDDIKYLEYVKKCVENYIVIENFAIHIVCASTNPADILDYLRDNERATGMYFLDLNLNNDMNGIDLAKKIREYDPWGAIVFITSDGDSHEITFRYRLEAMDYIVKGDASTNARICECIKNAHQKITSTDAAFLDKFVVKITKDVRGFRSFFNLAKDTIVSVDSRTILYFETSTETKHSIIMYTTSGNVEFRGNLSRIEKDLNRKEFYRCQRNYIVNLEKIIAIDAVQLTVIFENNMQIEISPKQVYKLSARVRSIKGLKT